MREKQRDRDRGRAGRKEGDRMYITIILTTGEKVTNRIEKLSFVSEADGLYKVLAWWDNWKDMLTINYDHIVMVRDATKEEIAGAQMHGY